MLLLNKTLLRLAKGLWGWIFAIVIVKLVTLIGITAFAKTISGFLGNIDSPSVTIETAGSAILSALVIAAVTFCSELLRGELEYRTDCPAYKNFF